MIRSNNNNSLYWQLTNRNHNKLPRRTAYKTGTQARTTRPSTGECCHKRRKAVTSTATRRGLVGIQQMTPLEHTSDKQAYYSFIDPGRMKGTCRRLAEGSAPPHGPVWLVVKDFDCSFLMTDGILLGGAASQPLSWVLPSRSIYLCTFVADFRCCKAPRNRLVAHLKTAYDQIAGVCNIFPSAYCGCH